MIEFLSQPWPWYIAGPIIGLIVPALLLYDSKQFGISANLRHICAAVIPGRVEFFNYDWKKPGTWNLLFAVGIVLGGLIAAVVLSNPNPVAISEATVADLTALGITDFSGLVPDDLFSWSALLSIKAHVALMIGGFLVGFGSRYAGGCTSGHGISGLANLQLPSLIAVFGFFVGGLVTTFFILPLLF